MAEWRRDGDSDAIALAAGIPDALAVLDAHGDLVGWDESDCCAYLAARGMPCGAECQARRHVELL